MTMNDPFAPNFQEDVYYGEIVIHDGYHAIMTYDVDGVVGWQKYEPENPAHQQAMATPTAKGKQRKTSIVYEVQHFPLGVNFETWVNTWVEWGDEWKGFRESLAKTWGFDLKDRNDWGRFYEKLAELKQSGNFFRYKTPTVRTYEKDGETKNVRGLQVVEQFASMEECQAAYEANLDGVLAEASSSIEEEPPVPTISRDDALKFIPALAKQIAKSDGAWLDLQAKIDEIPMLKDVLKADDKDVAEAAASANPDVFSLSF